MTKKYFKIITSIILLACFMLTNVFNSLAVITYTPEELGLNVNSQDNMRDIFIQQWITFNEPGFGSITMPTLRSAEGGLLNSDPLFKIMKFSLDGSGYTPYDSVDNMCIEMMNRQYPKGTLEYEFLDRFVNNKNDKEPIYFEISYTIDALVRPGTNTRAKYAPSYPEKRWGPFLLPTNGNFRKVRLVYDDQKGPFLRKDYPDHYDPNFVAVGSYTYLNGVSFTEGSGNTQRIADILKTWDSERGKRDPTPPQQQQQNTVKVIYNYVDQDGRELIKPEIDNPKIGASVVKKLTSNPILNYGTHKFYNVSSTYPVTFGIYVGDNIQFMAPNTIVTAVTFVYKKVTGEVIPKLEITAEDIRVPAGSKSANLRILLNAEESTGVNMSGNPEPITSYRFWCDVNSNKDFVLSAPKTASDEENHDNFQPPSRYGGPNSSYIYETTVDFSPIAAGQAIEYTIKGRIRVFSQPLQHIATNGGRAVSDEIVAKVKVIGVGEPDPEIEDQPGYESKPSVFNGIEFIPPNSYNVARANWTNNNAVTVRYIPSVTDLREPNTGTFQSNSSLTYKWEWTKWVVEYQYTSAQAQSLAKTAAGTEPSPPTEPKKPPYSTPPPDSAPASAHAAYKAACDAIDKAHDKAMEDYSKDKEKYDKDKAAWNENYSSNYTYYSNLLTSRPYAGTDSKVISGTFNGFWDLKKIDVSDAVNKTVTTGDTIRLPDGKELELSAKSAPWDENKQWNPNQPPVPTTDPYPIITGYNLGDISNVTNKTKDWINRIITATVPNKPTYSYIGSTKFYNIDTVRPDATIIENPNIRPNFWYGGPSNQFITISGRVSDDRSGIWSGSLYNDVSFDGISFTNDKFTSFSRNLENQNGPSETKSITFIRNGIHRVGMDVEDFAGNRDTALEEYYCLDRDEKPTIETPWPESRTWTNQPINIALTFRDQLSGLNIVQYRLNNVSHLPNYENKNEIDMNIDLKKAGQGTEHYGAEVKVINDSITIDKDGIYQLNITNVQDVVGNTSSYNPPNDDNHKYKYDATHPGVQITFNDTMYYNSRIEYQGEASNIITIAANDNLSGVEKVEYAFTQTPTVVTNWEPLNQPISTDEDTGAVSISVPQILNAAGTSWDDIKSGNWYLHLKVTDRAGNVLQISGDDASYANALAGIANGTPNAVADLLLQTPVPAADEGLRTKNYRAIPFFINKSGGGANSLRITKVYDNMWKLNNLEAQPITVSEMAVYNNQIPSKIKLGYRVDFKLDTIGYGRNNADDIYPADSLSVAMKQYIKVPKENPTDNGYHEVDIYVPLDKAATKYVKLDASSVNPNIAPSNYAMKSIRFEKTGILQVDSLYLNGADDNWTWNWSYYIRPDVKFVDKDKYPSAPDIIDPVSGAHYFVNPNVNPELLVAFEIVAAKGYGAMENYTAGEDKWGIGANNTTYGNKKSTGVDLLDYGGANHGEVFWYDIQHTALDDVEGQTNFGGY